MALAPLHLPAPAGRAGATRRARPTFLAPRRPRYERLDVRDALASPSDVAMRSAGVVHGFHR